MDDQLQYQKERRRTMKKKTLTVARDTLLITALLLVVVTIIDIMAGCTRRPLYGNLTPETALIPVHIDWSVSGIPLKQMHRVSVLLFPEKDGTPLEFRMETNLTDDVIQVPVGVYSVIVFNETTDPTDWSDITFKNKDSYDKFAAVALDVTESRGFYSRAEELPLIENPNPLAAWSLARFEVTEEILLRSRTASRAELAEEISDLTHIVPTPRIETMAVTARVENLSSAMQVTGILNGMSSGVYMASGEKMTTTGAHAFILSQREYDDEPNDDDGTTTNTFNIFGRHPATDHIDLHIDCLLTDGTMHPRESFDVGNMIERDTEAIPVSNNLLVGLDDRDPDGGDHEITLPDNMDLKAGVSVSDWDEIVIPLE
jgi:hypothetical protein